MRLFVDESVIRFASYDTVSDNSETDSRFRKDVRDLARISTGIYRNRSFANISEEALDRLATGAQLHRLAQLPGHYDLETKQVVHGCYRKLLRESQAEKYSKNFCPCGCKRTKSDPLPLCINEDQLDFMGSAVCLFLLMFRIALAVVSFALIYTIYALVATPLKNIALVEQCQHREGCNTADLTLPLSEASESTLLIIGAWLGVLVGVLQVITVSSMKAVGSYVDRRIDAEQITHADLTIKLDFLPFGQSTETTIVEFIQNQYRLGLKAAKLHNTNPQLQQRLSEFKDHIKSVNLVYNIRQARDLIDQIRKQAIEVDSCLGYLTPQITVSVQTYREEKAKLIDLIKKLDTMRNRFISEPAYRQSLSAGVCYVEFDNQKTRKEFLHMYGIQRTTLLRKTCRQLINKLVGRPDNNFKGRYVIVTAAPQPSDIIWRNCQQPYRPWRLLLIAVVALLIITTGFGIVVSLEYAIARVQSRTGNMALVQFLLTLISVVITAVDFLISWAVAGLGKFEYPHNYTNESIVRYDRAVYGAVLNCVILPLVSISMLHGSILGKDGLSARMLNFSITNCLLPLIFSLMNPKHFLKLLILKVTYLRNRVMKLLLSSVNNVQDIEYTTKINHFFASSDLDISGTYSYITTTMLHAAFYSVIQPWVIVVAIASVVLHYIAKKYLVLRRYSKPRQFNKLIFEAVLTGISFVPVMYGAGEITFAFILNLPARIWIILPASLTILLGVTSIINPCRLCSSLGNSVSKILSQSTKIFTRSTSLKHLSVLESLKGYNEVNDLSILLGFPDVIRGQDISTDTMNQVTSFTKEFRQYETAFDYPTFQAEPAIDPWGKRVTIGRKAGPSMLTLLESPPSNRDCITNQLL